MEQKEKTTELNFYENPRYKNKPEEFVAEDGNYICCYTRYVNEYTPPKQFRKIQKIYYNDGTLSNKTTFTLRSPINNVECDRDGFITKKVDFESDVRCDTIDGMDYLSFFEKEGWYDRSTGQTVFRHEPYPLNTGEFTKMIFHCFEFSYVDTTMYVQIKQIENVPQRFFDKYGKTREDGSKYLETKIYYPYFGDEEKDIIIEPNSRVGGFEVTYCIDVKSGTYKVDWKIVLKIE